MFPGGTHSGMTIANVLAIYACLFAVFCDANFAGLRGDRRGVAGAGPPSITPGFDDNCSTSSPVRAMPSTEVGAEVAFGVRQDRAVPAVSGDHHTSTCSEAAVTATSAATKHSQWRCVIGNSV